jgi:hypothetical protein
LLETLRDKLLDIDPDGSSRRLVGRISLALLVGFAIFSLLKIPTANIFWLVITTFNLLISLASAPKKGLIYYYLLAVLFFISMIFMGSFFNKSSELFIYVVGIVGFISGILGRFGVSGKMIGALGFVLFAASATLDIDVVSDVTNFLTTYLISASTVFLVMFVALPIPRMLIIEGSKKKYYKLLRDIFLGKMDFNTTKSVHVFEGVKENICNKLPAECELIVTKFLRLRNSSLMLKRYANEHPYGSEASYKISYILNEMCSICASIFDALAMDKRFDEKLSLYRDKKDEIYKIAQGVVNDVYISKKEKIHIVAELHIVTELWHFLESECKSTKA